METTIPEINKERKKIKVPPNKELRCLQQTVVLSLSLLGLLFDSVTAGSMSANSPLKHRKSSPSRLLHPYSVGMIGSPAEYVSLFTYKEINSLVFIEVSMEVRNTSYKLISVTLSGISICSPKTQPDFWLS